VPKIAATEAQNTLVPGGPSPGIATQIPSRAPPIGCATMSTAIGRSVLLLRPPRKSPIPHETAAARASAAANIGNAYSTGRVAATASSWFAW
jgi:hypothetical protein